MQRPCCSRCTSRSLPCKYHEYPRENTSPKTSPVENPVAVVDNALPNPGSRTLPTGLQSNQLLLNPFFGIDDPALNEVIHQDPDSTGANCEETYGSSTCGSDTLTTAVNTPEISGLNNDWLISLLPQPSHSDTTPPLAKHSMQVLFRFFRTWPRMIVKGFQMPPIFHQSTTPPEMSLPQPLSS